MLNKLSLLAAASVVGLALTTPSLAETSEAQLEYSVPSTLATETLLLDSVQLGNKLIAVGEFGHILTSSDRGETWTQAKVPSRATLTSISFFDENHGLAVGHDMKILRTEDGGASWELVYSDPESEMPLLGVIYASADHAIVVGAFSSMLESRDGGKTWEPRLLSPDSEDDYHLNDLFKGPSGAIYIPAEFGNVYRSTDNGETFEALQTPYEGSFWGGMALANDAILVWGMRGNAYLSEDRGKSWIKAVTNTDRSISGGIQLEDGRIVLTGLSGLVLVSSDGGKTFTETVREDRNSFAQVAPGPDAQTVWLLGDPGIRRQKLD